MIPQKLKYFIKNITLKYMKIHLVVNYICVDEHEILVGATDSERWQWDTEVGMSGADAKTIVWVVIKDNGKGYADSESVGLFCNRTETILRPLALAGIADLFEIAWEIKDKKIPL
ncbi:MAG: hypothetical protein EAZ85_06590 [Bacteroidetes bacterium]|nr:MAG: hypothetical protein EAZ85_06590 [Bacteroidota bacterium]TAG87571.1 MAG: hypothetical protein EAZ20_10400 [Bacteroidota bacterium]